jgi:hypothetical protein
MLDSCGDLVSEMVNEDLVLDASDIDLVSCCTPLINQVRVLASHT